MGYKFNCFSPGNFKVQIPAMPDAVLVEVPKRQNLPVRDLKLKKPKHGNPKPKSFQVLNPKP